MARPWWLGFCILTFALFLVGCVAAGWGWAPGGLAVAMSFGLGATYGVIGASDDAA